MTLVLVLVDPPTDIPGLKTTKVLSEIGGTLGRSSQCDFVLPDKELHVSKTHAIITFKDGVYTITDVSTNGTLIDSKTLQKGENQVLKNGSLLQLGSYHIKATVHSLSAEPPEISPDEVAAPTADVAVAAVATAGAAAVGVQLKPDLEAEQKARQQQIDGLVAQYDEVDKDSPNLSPRKVPIENQNEKSNIMSGLSLRSQEMTASEVANTAIEHFNLDEFISNESMQNTSKYMSQNFGITRSGVDYKEKHMAMAQDELKGAVLPRRGIDPQAQAILDDKLHVRSEEKKEFSDDMAVSLLLDSLGLKSIKLPKKEYPRFISDLSKVIKDAVDALIILLRDRSVVKSQLSGASTTFEKAENNPLKLSATVSEALNKMLIDPSNSYMDVDASFDEGLEDLRKHQTAVIAAARRTFDAMIKRFDPEYIDMRLKAVTKPGFIKRMTGTHWGRSDYVKYHKRVEGDLQMIFDEAFRDAYADTIK